MKGVSGLVNTGCSRNISHRMVRHYLDEAIIAVNILILCGGISSTHFNVFFTSEYLKEIFFDNLWL